MVTNFYFIVFVACIITTFTCVIRNKNIDSIYLLFDILVTCNCLGRYIIAGANNLQVALLGTKFLYLGGTLTVYLIVITLARLCNIKVSKILRGTLLLYSFVILILVFTIEHNDLYYNISDNGNKKGKNKDKKEEKKKDEKQKILPDK